MSHSKYKFLLAAAAAIFLASIAVLWSWNTLAELFGFPLAQYKHVVALAVLMFVLRSLFAPLHGVRTRLMGARHEHQAH